MKKRVPGRAALVLCAAFALRAAVLAQTDPLPSWNDGAAKKAIVDFVQTTTTQGSPKFVPPGERVATFNSIWRRESDGSWKVVFDKGCEVCRCAQTGK